MRTRTEQSPVDLREGYYSNLFAGELQMDSSGNEVQLGLCGLARATSLRGTRRTEATRYLDQVPQIVKDILLEHDIAASDPSGQSALFSFVEYDKGIGVGPNQEFVTNVVSDAVVCWEKVHYKNNRGILLPNKDSEARWLVIEAAAAVMEIASLPSLRDPTPINERVITKALTYWGPQFTRNWFNGTAIREWAMSTGAGEQEAEQILETFTPSYLRNFMIDNARDPLAACVRAKNNLDTVLSPGGIANLLGWPIETVETIFSPTVRKKLAAGNSADPTRPLRQVKKNVDEMLDLDLTAAALEWPKEKVRETFTDFELSYMCVRNLNNPMAYLKKVKLHLDETLTDANLSRAIGWTEEKVQSVFSPHMRKHFAINYRDPLAACVDWVNGNGTWRNVPKYVHHGDC